MGDTNPATEPQVKLIEQLYGQLRIRNTSLYGGAAPAQLAKLEASEVIDVLTLRKLSAQVGRPVTADLTDPAQVREQLARVQQLTDGHHTRHMAATAKRAEHLRKASRTTDGGEREKQKASAPVVHRLPHTRRQQLAGPVVSLTPQELSARAAELDRIKEPRLDAPSRYSDATGYGSAASYRENTSRSRSEAPQLSNEQEHKIIELQSTGADQTVSNTVVEASDYLDRVLAPPEPLPPTERQLAYLHKLERQAGITEEQLSNPGTRQAASRRIQRWLDAAARQGPAGGVDLDGAIALTGVASPRTIRDVAAAANSEPTQSQMKTESDRSSNHDLGR